MTKATEEWLRSGEYLPDFMRDFHDQKDLFKAIHQMVDVEKHDYAGGVNWVAGQCYTVDIFLWWMAKRGYVLRRARHKRAFNDLQSDVAAARQKQREASLLNLKAIMEQNKPKS